LDRGRLTGCRLLVLEPLHGHNALRKRRPHRARLRKRARLPGKRIATKQVTPLPPRELGLTEVDPTRDIRLPERTGTLIRPLDEDETIAVHHAAEYVTRPSLHAAAAALAFSAGTQVGSATSAWGPRPGRHIRLDAGRARVALSDLIARIGLGLDPRVKPTSVTTYATVRIFDGTGKIENVARGLGLRSPNRAADLVVGVRWTSRTVGRSRESQNSTSRALYEGGPLLSHTA
jgi:hypothetical protein